MIPTKSGKLPQTLIAIAVLIFMVKNPEGAAAAVTTFVDSFDRFLNSF